MAGVILADLRASFVTGEGDGVDDGDDDDDDKIDGDVNDDDDENEAEAWELGEVSVEFTTRVFSWSEKFVETG